MHISVDTSKSEAVDLGTTERARQGGGLRVSPRNISHGGIETDVGATAVNECALDVLMTEDPLTGHLAGSQGCKADRVAVARSRYNGGIRLRRLFMDAGLNPIRAQDFQPRIGGTTAPDMTDKQDRARSSYNRIIRQMGPMGQIVTNTACLDIMPTTEAWRSNLRVALDKLCMVYE